MYEVFGDSLVSAPVQDRPKISVLPSPEDLKGRILLKVCFGILPRDYISPTPLRIDEEPICLGERGNAAKLHLYRCRIFDVRGGYHGR